MFTTSASHAQDTVKKSNSIGNFTERFMVLKADKKVRHGSYKLYNNDNLVAIGSYDQGKRIGEWHFFSGLLEVQQYDYSNNKLINDYPDQGKISYNIPNVNPGDTVTNPVKIGGYLAGFKLMQAFTNYTDNLKGLKGTFKLDNIIAIDEYGKILSWILRITTDSNAQIKRIAFNNIPEDVCLFAPAKVNGRAIASTVVFSEQLYTISNIVSETNSVQRTGNGSGIPTTTLRKQ